MANFFIILDEQRLKKQLIDHQIATPEGMTSHRQVYELLRVAAHQVQDLIAYGLQLSKSWQFSLNK